MSDRVTIPLEAISRASANTLADAAIRSAATIGFGAAVAIADTTGTLRAFQRDDTAAPFTAAVAIGKAWTAASAGLPTHVWNDFLADPALAPMAHVPGLVAVAGGYPIVHDGRTIGGIGVSGGQPAQDRAAAAGALAECGFVVQ